MGGVTVGIICLVAGFIVGVIAGAVVTLLMLANDDFLY